MRRDCPTSPSTRLTGYVRIGQSREEFRYVTGMVLIRSETSADVSAITEVTIAAFKTLAISNHTEQFIIAALRDPRTLPCRDSNDRRALLATRLGEGKDEHQE
jgi:hypothetical protein